MYAIFYRNGDSHTRLLANTNVPEKARKWAEDMGIQHPVIKWYVPRCERCRRDNGSDVPHDNCMYGGNRVGHSKAHCTAGGCW
jgi:hypothetical protein